MRYRELVAREIKLFKKSQRERKAFKEHTERIEKLIIRARRPKDSKGRVIKKNIWGDEIVRVKNKWTLRSDVAES